MQEKTEHWLQLCQLAAVEEDPAKLLALITEINNLLEAKEERLKHKGSGAPFIPPATGQTS